MLIRISVSNFKAYEVLGTFLLSFSYLTLQGLLAEGNKFDLIDVHSSQMKHQTYLVDEVLALSFIAIIFVLFVFVQGQSSYLSLIVAK